MIQILDVSDKILNNEMKFQQKILELINATVSHELRNPLNSLMSQILNFEYIFDSLKQTFESIDMNNNQKTTL